MYSDIDIIDYLNIPFRINGNTSTIVMEFDGEYHGLFVTPDIPLVDNNFSRPFTIDPSLINNRAINNKTFLMLVI